MEKREDKIQFYTDADGKYRWRKVAPNGDTVLSSNGSRTRKTACVRDARKHAGFTGNARQIVWILPADE